MIAQNQVLNKILLTKDFSLVSLNNLTRDNFFDYVAEFDFIKTHYETYGNIPDRLTFINAFPSFDIVDVQEPNTYLLEQLYKEYNQAYLAQRFNKIKSLLETDKVDEATEYFMKSVDGLHQGGVMTCTDLLADTSRYDRYVERTTDVTKYYLSTGFYELDKLLGGIDRENENMVIIARTGIGKCLAKGTKILMADGTTKAVEDVKIGDKVQSYNCVNTVQALHNGISNGYKIIPNKGEPFIVSANHILTLQKYNEVYNKTTGKMTIADTSSLVDIMVEDFLALSGHQKHLYKLFRPAINYSRKDLLIDPYILGAWLGDGISSQNQICSADPEIKQTIANYCLAEGFECHNMPSTDKKGTALKLYSLTGKNKSGKYFKALLKDYGLVNNKHIPLDYLTSDSDQRLQLLAGLLDTDGCYLYKKTAKKPTNMFDFTNKNKVLFDNVAQLARGLGFKVCIGKPKRVKAFTTENIETYYRMTISGDLHTIPTKVARKQAVPSKHNNPLVTGFKIEPVETVEYYGFMADGDHRYLLADNTLTHNTQILLKMAAAASMQGLNVGIYEGEMTADKVGYRIDTFLGHISNTGLNRGDLVVKQDYESYIKNLPNMDYGSIKVLTPNDVPGERVTVDTLKAFIEREHLDILFVDQYDLLDDKHYAKTYWEKVANIARDVKQLQVAKKIPIISVSQMNRQKNEDGSQDTTQVAGSDMIPRYATIILALEQKIDEESKGLNLLINTLKARDGGNGHKLVYRTSFNTGTFTYIPTENDGITDSNSFQEQADRYALARSDMPF